MKTSILLLSVVLFTGCTTSSIFNNLNVGMTKKEAIAAVGEPVNTSAKDNLEYLNYSLLTNKFSQHATRYYIRLKDGHVDTFGQRGDFTPPTTRVIEDKHITIKKENITPSTLKLDPTN